MSDAIIDLTDLTAESEPSNSTSHPDSSSSSLSSPSTTSFQRSPSYTTNMPPPSRILPQNPYQSQHIEAASSKFSPPTHHSQNSNSQFAVYKRTFDVKPPPSHIYDSNKSVISKMIDIKKINSSMPSFGPPSSSSTSQASLNTSADEDKSFNMTSIGNKLFIEFILTDTLSFSFKCENSSIFLHRHPTVLYHIYYFLINNSSASFNFQKKRWELLIEDYNTFLNFFLSLSAYVELQPLPQTVLAVSQMKLFELKEDQEQRKNRKIELKNKRKLKMNENENISKKTKFDDDIDIENNEESTDDEEDDDSNNFKSKNEIVKDELYRKFGLPMSLIDSLAPFQREGVQFIVSKNGRTLIADEMGLGKTRTAIAGATVYYQDWPLLILTPSSARHHWKNEILSLISLGNIGNMCEDEDDIIKYKNDHRICPPDRDWTGIQESDILVIDSGDQNLRRFFGTYKIFITSYSLFPTISKKFTSILPNGFKVVIADESHYIKNKDAQRTIALLPVLKNSQTTILLSGTPALSRPLELYTQLNAINPKQFSDYNAYGKRYCRSERKADGTIQKSRSYKGASNSQELHIILTSTIMIRRLKKNILKDLPPKKRFLMKINIQDEELNDIFKELLLTLQMYKDLMATKKNSSQYIDSQIGKEKIKEIMDRFEIFKLKTKRRKENLLKRLKDAENNSENNSDILYTRMLENEIEKNNDLENPISEETENNKDIAQLGKIKKNALMYLFNESGLSKLPSIVEKLESFLDNKANGKIIIFAHHKIVIESLIYCMNKRKEKFIRIDGSTKSIDRQNFCTQFQTNPSVRVGLLSITAAGIALTLTAASVLFFAELFWTPGSLLQAEDRIHRIGQTRPVKIFYFFGINTVDEILWPMIRKKMQILGEVVEGVEDSDLQAGAFKKNFSEMTKQKDKDNSPKEISDADVLEIDQNLIDFGSVNHTMPNANEDLIESILSQEELHNMEQIDQEVHLDPNSENDDEDIDDYEEFLKKNVEVDFMASTFLRMLTLDPLQASYDKAKVSDLLNKLHKLLNNYKNHPGNNNNLSPNFKVPSPINPNQNYAGNTNLSNKDVILNNYNDQYKINAQKIIENENNLKNGVSTSLARTQSQSLLKPQDFGQIIELYDTNVVESNESEDVIDLFDSDIEEIQPEPLVPILLDSDSEDDSLENFTNNENNPTFVISDILNNIIHKINYSNINVNDKVETDNFVINSNIDIGSKKVKSTIRNYDETFINEKNEIEAIDEHEEFLINELTHKYSYLTEESDIDTLNRDFIIEDTKYYHNENSTDNTIINKEFDEYLSDSV